MEKETFDEYEKKAESAFENMCQVADHLAKFSTENGLSSPWMEKEENPFSVILSLLLQETLIEIGISDGDFSLNEKLFIETFAKKKDISLLDLTASANRGTPLTWNQVFMAQPNQISDALGALRPQIQGLSGLFCSVFSISLSGDENDPLYLNFVQDISEFTDAFLSIDLKANEIERQRAVDILEDNFFKPLKQAFANKEQPEDPVAQA